MLTRKRFIPPGYVSGNPEQSYRNLTKAVADYLQSLEAPESLSIEKAHVNGSPVGDVTPDTGAFTTVTASSSILSNSPTAGIGYSAGAGGTVTQQTSKATGVTLNKICGEITMNNAALAGGVVVSFALANSTIAAADMVDVQINPVGSTPGGYNVWAESSSGTATIYVLNRTGGSLSEALVIRFRVQKTVTA